MSARRAGERSSGMAKLVEGSNEDYLGGQAGSFQFGCADGRYNSPSSGFALGG